MKEVVIEVAPEPVYTDHIGTVVHAKFEKHIILTVDTSTTVESEQFFRVKDIEEKMKIFQLVSVETSDKSFGKYTMCIKQAFSSRRSTEKLDLIRYLNGKVYLISDEKEINRIREQQCYC